MSHRGRKRSRQVTDTEGVIGSNSNHKRKTRCLTQIFNFSINNIIGHGYSRQFTTQIMKLIKNLLGSKQLEARKAMIKTVKPTPKVLNFDNFLSIIDQIILSKL